jgi:hypothetical protein
VKADKNEGMRMAKLLEIKIGALEDAKMKMCER